MSACCICGSCCNLCGGGGPTRPTVLVATISSACNPPLNGKVINCNIAINCTSGEVKWIGTIANVGCVNAIGSVSLTCTIDCTPANGWKITLHYDNGGGGTCDEFFTIAAGNLTVQCNPLKWVCTLPAAAGCCCANETGTVTIVPGP